MAKQNPVTKKETKKAVNPIILNEGDYLSRDYFQQLLPAPVADLFVVTDAIGKRTSTRIITAKYGEIDFSILTVRRAEQLLRNGCPYLIKRNG